MKYGNLNFLEPSWPLQACNGTALSLLLYDVLLISNMNRRFNGVPRYLMLSAA